MNLSLSPKEFNHYVLRQVDHFFPDNARIDTDKFSLAFDLAVDRTHHCFKHLRLTSYCSQGETYLNHLHSDQYAVFLWFLSNSVWKETEDEKLAAKFFYLNKSLHSFNCMYDTNLPDIFLFLHLMGTVLGKAAYSDFLVVTQGCTVGAHRSKYPQIGKGASLLPNTSIIGDSHIGNYVSLGISTVVYEQDIPDRHIVYRDNQGTIHTKRSVKPWSQQFFNIDFS
ncbi:hypothetical protein A7K50_08480 [Dehalobacter sp. MCB1]|uniref:serine acetyltransferase n=1 Tax=Dehalobacter sp. 12DCB1 TaxID=2070364 RepID=UPI00039CEFB1|nr:serine acetyltransferase [Dehalobacter sp. 12DCB1]RJE48780.1 hypothetical protein A7K50_08480 [Dehalobacter sp. MCB1]TCX51872.1 serine acetyltransferase [Dehalobacter sp. 14DCB1]TCX52932.1 serine acetyltransferase [Dehalobacter sp. 12DCB1]